MRHYVFLWTDISGYMAACWRALVARQDVRVSLVALKPRGAQGEAAFDPKLVAGLHVEWVEQANLAQPAFIEAIVRRLSPSVLIVGGWHSKAYRSAARSAQARAVPTVMVMDTPWWGTARQRAGLLLLRSYVRSMSRVVVPGERAWQYALRLGVDVSRIRRGMYGIEMVRGAAAAAKRAQGPWPRRFLFTGRYHPEKGLDLLVEGYRRYRSESRSPWSLTCCGQGPLKSLLAGVEGVEDRGFVQPDEMVNVWAQSGALVLPSRYDPWPLILVEGAAAGLPLIASEVCGSTVELLRDGFNGWLLRPSTPETIAAAMHTAERQEAELSVIGGRCRSFAEPYAADLWAPRWDGWLSELCVGTLKA